jgi:hypothetical protein
LRITYFGDATCRLYAEGPSVSHGLAFVPDRKIANEHTDERCC